VEYIAGSLANGDLRDVGVEVEDSITRRVPLEGPPGDNLRATKIEFEGL
jgi:hypothetical protein